MRNKKSNVILVVITIASLPFLWFESEDHRWSQQYIRKQVHPTVESKKARHPDSQANGDVCLKDQLTTEKLLQEIRDLEIKYNLAKNQNTTFYDLKLNYLSKIEASFLNNQQYIDKDRNQSWVARHESQDQCKSFECLVLKSYDKPSAWVGHFYYWFKLKTGYQLSLQNGYPLAEKRRVEIKKPEGFSAQKYRYSERELKAIWWMVNALPENMFHLNDLNLIARTPEGHTPAEWLDDGVIAYNLKWYEGAFILATDDCLKLGDNDFVMTDMFYECLIHEMAHSLDRSGVLKSNQKYSNQEEFLKLSNWKQENLVQADGKVEQAWVHSDRAKFVSWYAKSSPAEDFAETYAFFRGKPMDTFKAAPDKYKYFKQTFFNRLGYTLPELESSFKSQVLNELLSKEFESDEQVLAAIKSSVLEIKRTHPDGCDVFSKIEDQWVADVYKNAQKKLNLGQYASQRSALKSLQSEINAKFNGRLVFLNCELDVNPSACYEIKLNATEQEMVQNQSRWLKTLGQERVQAFLNEWKTQNSHDQMQKMVTRFYDGIFDPYLDLIDDKIEVNWLKCVANDNLTSTTDPSVISPFDPADQYLDSNILTCLNLELPKLSSEVRTHVGLLSQIRFASEASIQWIDRNIILEEANDIWMKSLRMKNAEDLKIIQKLDRDLSDTHFKLAKLESDSSICLKKYADLFLVEMKKNLIRFTALEPMANRFAKRMCAK